MRTAFRVSMSIYGEKSVDKRALTNRVLTTRSMQQSLQYCLSCHVKLRQVQRREDTLGIEKKNNGRVLYDANRTRSEEK